MGAAGAGHTGGPGVAPVSSELLFPLLGILVAPLNPLVMAVLLGLPEAGGTFTMVPDVKSGYVKPVNLNCIRWLLGDWGGRRAWGPPFSQ